MTVLRVGPVATVPGAFQEVLDQEVFHAGQPEFRNFDETHSLDWKQVTQLGV